MKVKNGEVANLQKSKKSHRRERNRRQSKELKGKTPLELLEDAENGLVEDDSDSKIIEQSDEEYLEVEEGEKYDSEDSDEDEARQSYATTKRQTLRVLKKKTNAKASKKKGKRASLVGMMRRSLQRLTGKSPEGAAPNGLQKTKSTTSFGEDLFSDTEDDILNEYPEGISVLLTFPLEFVGTHTLVKLLSMSTEHIKKVRVCIFQDSDIATIRSFAGDDSRIEFRKPDPKFLDLLLKDITIVLYDGPRIDTTKISHKVKDLDDFGAECAEQTEKFMLACEAAGVDKVILLSSTSTIEHAVPWGGSRCLSESDWNNVADAQRLVKICRDPVDVWKKMAVEKTAIAFSKEKESSVKLVSILPSMVIGPLLIDQRPVDMEYIFRLLEGNLQYVVDYSYPIIDVRDVAFAFAAAISSQQAVGKRIALTGDRAIHMLEHVTTTCDELANLVEDSALADRLANYRPKVLTTFRAKLQSKFDHQVAMAQALGGQKPKFSSYDFSVSSAHLYLGFKFLIPSEESLLHGAHDAARVLGVSLKR